MYSSMTSQEGHRLGLGGRPTLIAILEDVVVGDDVVVDWFSILTLGRISLARVTMRRLNTRPARCG